MIKLTIAYQETSKPYRNIINLNVIEQVLYESHPCCIGFQGQNADRYVSMVTRRLRRLVARHIIQDFVITPYPDSSIDVTFETLSMINKYFRYTFWLEGGLCANNNTENR